MAKVYEQIPSSVDAHPKRAARFAAFQYRYVSGCRFIKPSAGSAYAVPSKRMPGVVAGRGTALPCLRRPSTARPPASHPSDLAPFHHRGRRWSQG